MDSRKVLLEEEYLKSSYIQNMVNKGGNPGVIGNTTI